MLVQSTVQKLRLISLLWCALMCFEYRFITVHWSAYSMMACKYSVSLAAMVPWNCFNHLAIPRLLGTLKWFYQATVLESRVFKPATCVRPIDHMHSGTGMTWYDGGHTVDDYNPLWLDLSIGRILMVLWITARTTLWGECSCLQRSHQRLRKVQALGKCCGPFLRVARASRMKK